MGLKKVKFSSSRYKKKYLNKVILSWKNFRLSIIQKYIFDYTINMYLNTTFKVQLKSISKLGVVCLGEMFLFYFYHKNVCIILKKQIAT